MAAALARRSCLQATKGFGLAFAMPEAGSPCVPERHVFVSHTKKGAPTAIWMHLQSCFLKEGRGPSSSTRGENNDFET